MRTGKRSFCFLVTRLSFDRVWLCETVTSSAMTKTRDSKEENEKEPEKESEEEGYAAFDLYPERRFGGRGELKDYEISLTRTQTYTDRYKCEARVLNAFRNNPLLRILYKALKDAGCPLDISRHISCEDCDSKVTGGYDSEWNQIIICQNQLRASHLCANTLIHELIHMYDYCTGHIEFRNLEHLACTEIRAANLSHCSFLSSFFLGQSSFFNIKATHQYCVKMKATQSLMVSRQLDFDTALKIVVKVFDKCYNDLEPIGRRVRRKSVDHNLAYNEYKHYGSLH